MAELGPPELVDYLAGRWPELVGSTADAINNFSAANILEPMDTVVLERVKARSGDDAVAELHEAVARAALATLVELYGDRHVIVPLDAGHGGSVGYYWDPGSEGTEARHARAVVAAMERLVGEGRYPTITLRRVFNDAIPDDFRVKSDRNIMVYNQIVARQARGSLLAASVAKIATDGEGPVVHQLSAHFNAGANGLLVLYQANVDERFAHRSREYATRFARIGLAAINATGWLSPPLKVWGRDGTADDVMMYRPPYISAADAAWATPRYSSLQGSPHLRRYVDTILAHWP